MSERFLTFECDGATLAGILHEPEESRRDLGVLVVVGGPQYRVGSHRQFVLMARQLAAAGYPVFRFDYRGMGDGEGEPRTFEAVDDDIRAAIETFQHASPGLIRIVIFGLCDAASAALMYCVQRDPRITDLVLANPWVRTEVGEAKALVQHYYGRRLLQRSFWRKLWSRQLDVGAGLEDFIASLKQAAVDIRTDDRSQHFTRRMLTGLEAFQGRILLLMSGRDLTAREFDEFTRASRGWSAQLKRPGVERVNLPRADHTFSGAAALAEATGAVASWLGSAPRA